MVVRNCYTRTVINFEQLTSSTRKKELRLFSVKPTSPAETKGLHPYKYDPIRNYIFQNVRNTITPFGQCRLIPTLHELNRSQIKGAHHVDSGRDYITPTLDVTKLCENFFPMLYCKLHRASQIHTSLIFLF